jgi:hypothetical protein
MKHNLKKLIVTVAAVATLAPALHAQSVSLVTVGGNASIKLITNRIPAILSGAVYTQGSTNLIFRFTGNYGTTNVTWDFNLTGGAGAVLDLVQGNQVQLVSGTGVPNFVTTITAPETVGINPTGLNQDITLVAPIVLVANSNSTDLVGLTNLTQRQAVYLEASGGSLPPSYFGGASSVNPLYWVGRNSIAAVRQVLDANTFASGENNFTTNGSGQPIPYLDGQGNPSGAGSGTEVVAIVNAIPDSIGSVAGQDYFSASPLVRALSYEGVPYSPANVINGSYPLWGYERYIYFASGLQAPTPQQKQLIQALEGAIENPTFQASSSFTNKFISYPAVNASVQRDIHVDGGPITSQLY